MPEEGNLGEHLDQIFALSQELRSAFKEIAEENLVVLILVIYLRLTKTLYNKVKSKCVSLKWNK